VVSFTSRTLYLRGRAPYTHLMGGWVGPRTGLGGEEKNLTPYWKSNSEPSGVQPVSMSSRPALGPSQPPIQWVTRALSPELKRPGRAAEPTFALLRICCLATGARLSSRYLETVLAYLFFSWASDSNNSTRYNTYKYATIYVLFIYVNRDGSVGIEKELYCGQLSNRNSIPDRDKRFVPS
jgi:hypothetical protein